MSLIGKNIKKIRSAKKLSQAQFANIFDLTRGSIGAYEEERAEPKIDTIIQIANYFGLSVDLLLTKELTVKELFSLDIVKQKFNQAHDFEPKQERALRPGGIGLVGSGQYTEYIVNHGNKDFLAALPQVYLPVDFKGTTRAFEVHGSEMEYHQNGLHHGDILLALKVTGKLKSLVLQKVYVIIHDTAIYVRRLKAMDGEQLVYTSDDPNYAPLELETKQIHELWEVKGVYSTYLHPPKMMDEKLMLLEHRMNEMEVRLSRVSSKK